MKLSESIKLKNIDTKYDQPIPRCEDWEKSPLVWAIANNAYSRLSEFTGIEKSTRYSFRTNEVIEIRIRHDMICLIVRFDSVFTNFICNSKK